MKPYTSIPSQFDSRKVLGWAAHQYYVGIIARLAAGKGHLDLLKAFKQFVSIVPHAKLVLVGEGESRREIQIAIEEMDLGDSTLLMGMRTDIAVILAALDMFVLPSESEGIPMTILEAMAAELPVIATAIGGIPQVVIQGVTGILVPPRDPGALLTAMTDLYSEPDQARQMGTLGRKRLELHFDSRAMVNEYEVIYGGITRSLRAS